MLCVGVDFGTSNSSAAVYDGRSIRLLPLDQEASDPCVMRSLVYIERSGAVWFGQTALSRYLEQNTGRAVHYERQRVGEVTMVFAEVGTVVQEAMALIDVSEPGRLFQSLKRFLPVTSFRATNVFGLHYTIEELLSLLARELLSRIQATLGAPFTRLCVGWPVRFSEHPHEEALARQRLREAWRLAGVADVDFVEEPLAAIRHVAVQHTLGDARHVLVFDFGGGTLDICVARLARGGVQTLATRGVAIGGDLLDSRIVETQLTPLFGDGAVQRSRGLPLPRYLFTRLRSWQTLLELNTPQHMALIRRIKHEVDRPEHLAALEALVEKNYGVAFFQAVEGAKVRLSDHHETEVRLVNADLRLRHPLTRAAFEAAIDPQVRAARECVELAVSAAGVAPDAIDLVLTTGGSSRIPAVRCMLSDALPRARLQESDLFTSVASGLALTGGLHTGGEFNEQVPS
jgi:hypothetical chaperone protein